MAGAADRCPVPGIEYRRCRGSTTAGPENRTAVLDRPVRCPIGLRATPSEVDLDDGRCLPLG